MRALPTTPNSSGTRRGNLTFSLIRHRLPDRRQLDHSDRPDRGLRQRDQRSERRCSDRGVQHQGNAQAAPCRRWPAHRPRHPGAAPHRHQRSPRRHPHSRRGNQRGVSLHPDRPPSTGVAGGDHDGDDDQAAAAATKTAAATKKAAKQEGPGRKEGQRCKRLSRLPPARWPTPGSTALVPGRRHWCPAGRRIAHAAPPPSLLAGRPLNWSANPAASTQLVRAARMVAGSVRVV